MREIFLRDLRDLRVETDRAFAVGREPDPPKEKRPAVRPGAERTRRITRTRMIL